MAIFWIWDGPEPFLWQRHHLKCGDGAGGWTFTIVKVLRTTRVFLCHPGIFSLTVLFRIPFLISIAILSNLRTSHDEEIQMIRWSVWYKPWSEFDNEARQSLSPHILDLYYSNFTVMHGVDDVRSVSLMREAASWETYSNEIALSKRIMTRSS